MWVIAEQENGQLMNVTLSCWALPKSCVPSWRKNAVRYW